MIIRLSCADDGDGAGGSDGCLPDQRVWSVHKCSDVFQLRYIYTIHSLYLLKPTEQSRKGNSVVCSHGYFALICHAKHSFSQFRSITLSVPVNGYCPAPAHAYMHNKTVYVCSMS